MSKSTILTTNAPTPIGPYSQGILAKGSFLFTAGQVAIDPKTGQIVAGDIKAQTRQVMQNVQAILEQSGLSFASVVKTMVFLKDMNEFSKVNEIYKKYFGENPPARSTVEVSRLPKDVLFEMDAIACLD